MHEHHSHADAATGDAEVSRRTFLKLAGFAFTGAVATGCQRAPVQHAIPPLTEPAGIVPGRAVDYATTCAACPAGCGMLAKTRDGRPIKLEGDPNHPLSRGGSVRRRAGVDPRPLRSAPRAASAAQRHASDLGGRRS